MNFLLNHTGVLLGIIIAIVVIIILASGYVKAPPDKAYIISGIGKKARVVIGKASVKIPFLERLDKLDLSLMSVDVKTASAVPTADYINIMVDAAVNVKVALDPDGLSLAQQNFLNKDKVYIVGVAREVLEGNMREIVGTMELRDMVSNRQKFADKVKENAAPDLAKMGLDVVSFNVQNFTDSQGVIDNLGIDNISKIQKDASIARAVADRDVAVARANAEKEANDAKVAANLEIATKQNDLAIKQAELKKASDIKKAEADAAYTIQQEEQRKQIEITTANANIARQEKEVELETQKIAIQERRLDAEVRKRQKLRSMRMFRTPKPSLQSSRKKPKLCITSPSSLQRLQKHRLTLRDIPQSSLPRVSEPKVTPKLRLSEQRHSPKQRVLTRKPKLCRKCRKLLSCRCILRSSPTLQKMLQSLLQISIPSQCTAREIPQSL